jgi:MoaA/NifB/PqqE/SkfB family radical SAM enzyme
MRGPLDVPSDFPRRVNVELTNHCNQRCRLCPRQDFTRPLGFMDPALFERIARECASRDTTLWLHFLGEPLLHRQAVRLVRVAKEVGVPRVGLSTNAVSLAGPTADGLIDAGLDRLECSMDADEREGYRAMRGRDHFERVTRNVRAFLLRKRARGAERPVVSVQFMRTPEVQARLEALVEAWRPWLGPGDFVMSIRPASFAGAIDAAPSGGPPPGAPRPPCRWLFESLVVLQDGTVTMCGADWDARHPLGDLRTAASLREIWTGPEAERRRAAHRAGRFADVGPCAGCEDWRLADGHGYSNLLHELSGVVRQLRQLQAPPGS